MKPLTILYLYAELMGYQISTFKELTNKYGANLHIVHWDHKKLTPYIPPNIPNVNYYKRSQFSKDQLLELAENIKPNLVYVSGWMDKEYLSVCMRLKKKKIPVVAGSDTQWKGNFRQQIASIIFPFTLKKCFNYIWVAGPYQYEYARKLGFKKQEIIFNCLSADVNLFNISYVNAKSNKLQNYPHSFLFVGRFEKIKGLYLLIQAWENLRNERKDWKLCLIGNGSLKSLLIEQSDLLIKDFMQPEKLIDEISQAGCFILPSQEEPWALVLHEFSAAGLPIICSEVCGAAPVFVIPSFNGYTFTSNDINDLINKMREIINSSDQKLNLMSQNSHIMGQKINPEIVAASLLSVLN